MFEFRNTLAAAGVGLLAGLALIGQAAFAQDGPKATVQVVEYQAGPNWQVGTAPENQNLGGHFEMIATHFGEGTLLANGPTLDDFHGFYIFNTGDENAVRAILDSDQGLTSGVLSEVGVENWQLFIENLGADTGTDMLFVLNYLPGAAWEQGKTLFEQSIDHHMQYVGGLAEAGSLLAGGPVSDTHGRYIIAAENTAGAYAMISNDPSVQANTFVVQVKPWAPFNRQGLN